MKKKPRKLDLATSDNFKLSEAETPRFGDKRDVAKMVGVNRRTIDNFLAEGCPHLKLGTRRVRFDLDEVATWFKQKFTTRRFCRAPKATTAKPEAA